MASPAFRSSASGTGVDTSFTGSDPAGAASGDGLIFMILVGLSHSGFTINGVWNAVPNCNNLAVGSAFQAYTYYTLRGGSAPSYAVSWTTSQYFEYSIFAYSGVVGASFIDASQTTASSSGTDVNPPAITATTANTKALALAWHWAGWGGGGATAPAGYALRYGPATIDHALADIDVAAAGSVDPGAFGSAGGSDVWRGMTIALASEAGGGGGGAETPVDHSSALSFPALCLRPQNDNGRWTRGRGGLWERDTTIHRAA